MTWTMLPDPSVRNRTDSAGAPLLEPLDAALLQAFLDRAPLPVLVADDERQITEVNGRWIATFGYTRDRALGMRIDDFVSDASKPGLATRWADLLANGAATARVGVLCADGTPVSVRYTAVANVLRGRHIAAFLTHDPPRLRPTRGRRGGILTLREQESLRLVSMGMTTSVAAQRLAISPETVRTHVRNAMNKLGARTRAQAIAIAMREGEIPS